MFIKYYMNKGRVSTGHSGLAENLREQAAELVDEEEFTSHVSISLVRTSSSGNELIMVYSLISVIFFGVSIMKRGI